MLQYFINKVHGNRFHAAESLARADLRALRLHRKSNVGAIKESAEGAGARSVYHHRLNRWPPPSGAGLPVHEPRGSMVLDIGGGTSEVAVISLNGIVYAASARIGGDRFDEAISRLRAPQLRHPDRRCQRPSESRWKSARPYPGQTGSRDVGARGATCRKACRAAFTLNSNEILEALQEPLQGIVSAVKQALEQTPPELGSDVAERGIVLTGGGALLQATSTSC
jgi:rod shape-determining protein MreB